MLQIWQTLKSLLEKTHRVIKISIIEYFNLIFKEDEDFCRQLLELDGKVLGCFCKPQACHGDILIAAINYLKGQNNE